MGFKQRFLEKPFSPVNLALVLTVFLIIWLALGDRKSANTEAPEANEEKAVAANVVETRISMAQTEPRHIVVQGQVHPWQFVTLTAQVAGQVVSIEKAQGETTAQGEVLLKLTDEGRTERLAQAKAAVRLRETELASAKTLEKSRFVPETELRQLENTLAQAKAELITAKLAIEHSQPSAPFDGIADRRYVELGEWVAPGQPLVDVVQIDRFKVTAQIPQQDVQSVSVGQEVTLTLLDGRELQGKISFVSFAADENTRTYMIEVESENPERWRVAGGSATLNITLPAVQAHRVSPALLNLSAQGRLGVYAVNAQSQVEFHPVKVISVDNQAATVTGLPDRIALITLGGGFVKEGETVTAKEAAE